jgi:hypothetical protein
MPILIHIRQLWAFWTLYIVLSTHIYLNTATLELRGTLMKTGPVGEEMPGRQSNVCILSHVIVADVTCVKQSFKVCIKDHKYNLMQGLLEKSKLSQHS